MSRQNRSRGFSLIELMIAMVLGLVIVGGVISVLIANKRSYSTNEGMSQIAETVRTAYELMARDSARRAARVATTARRSARISRPAPSGGRPGIQSRASRAARPTTRFPSARTRASV